MSAPVRRLGKVELLTKPGRPSPARLAVCTLLAAAVGTVGLTVIFLIGAATKGASVLEIAGIAVGLLIFYAPASMWTGGLWSVGAILVAGLGAAVLTHRYRLTGSNAALQRTGRVAFGLLLVYSVWVFVVGVAFLAYAD
jgi:hypothetical protein